MPESCNPRYTITISQNRRSVREGTLFQRPVFGVFVVKEKRKKKIKYIPGGAICHKYIYIPIRYLPFTSQISLTFVRFFFVSFYWLELSVDGSEVQITEPQYAIEDRKAIL